MFGFFCRLFWSLLVCYSTNKHRTGFRSVFHLRNARGEQSGSFGSSFRWADAGDIGRDCYRSFDPVLRHQSRKRAEPVLRHRQFICKSRTYWRFEQSWGPRLYVARQLRSGPVHCSGHWCYQRGLFPEYGDRPQELGRMLGREQAGLSASDQFQTSFRRRFQVSALSDSRSPCHSVISVALHSPCYRVVPDAQSCRMHRVMSDAQESWQNFIFQKVVLSSILVRKPLP